MMTNELEVGNIIKGKVTGIENYGIFVQFENNYSGLIHISEVSEDFVRDINNYVSLGEIVYCQILEVDNINKKVKLSIKDINYKSTPSVNGVEETRLGFYPLKEHLNIWMEEKLKIYKNND